FEYLDDSVDPPEWVEEWPPTSTGEVTAGPDPGVPKPAETARPPSLEPAAPGSVRPPRAVKITVFMLGEISPRPTSFTTVVNVPSR
ncbi:MAG: hypothetical protein JSV16_06160, partial [Candidatus Hydrogenedentota bacterium]